MDLVVFGGAMPAIGARSITSNDRKLRQLNEQYIEAYMKSDVGWYREHLAEDFVCIESDGAVLGKTEFLDQTAKGPNVAAYRLDQVQVRIYGVAALVQATGLFTRENGSHGKSRYTDVYVREGDEWKVVSAQITRTANPER
jgi:ketosteroid isomerase-like protein